MRVKTAASTYESNHRVISVEPYGVEDVYDLQVNPHHNFVANGIVIHNSIDETRYFLSLAPSVVRHETVAAPLTGLERIATLRAKWNPLGGSFEHPGSWMTT